MSGRADAHRAALGGRCLQLVAQPGDKLGLRIGLGDPVAEDRGGIEPARVVQDRRIGRRGDGWNGGVEHNSPASLHQAPP
jgi:hypothetical protein